MTGILQALLSFFGVSTASSANYIEDVFSTYLYTGDGSGFSVNNGIDLSTKGGLVWLKDRSAANIHSLYDTVRGATNFIRSDSSNAQSSNSNSLAAFNSNGFDIGDAIYVNTASNRYVSWTFREQAKFFDVVTYTGNGSNRTISHNLGSVPGCIIIKSTSSAGDWAVYHRGATSANTSGAQLNSTDAFFNVGSAWWNSTAPTSTVFSLGTSGSVNSSGVTYVAYLFAHDAGGFGLSGTDNVISCGSYVGNADTANGPIITLGYEPQWVLIKNIDVAGWDWYIGDNMRGLPWGDSIQTLRPNLTSAEASQLGLALLPNGFKPWSASAGINGSGNTYIYIAIRRGPMKTPTSGTSVFTPVTYTGNNASNRTISTSKTYVTDWVMTWDRTNGTFGTGSGYNSPVITRLTGFGVNPPYLKTNSTDAEGASVVTITLNNAQFDYTVSGASGNLNGSGINYINWNFGRAPGFFDVVCYQGNSTANRQVSHNLTVAPELIIVKKRNGADLWTVYNPRTVATNNVLYLNQNGGLTSNAAVLFGNGTSVVAPTATNFTLGAFTYVNDSANTYIAYLFATVAGVSKVGSYTGTGTTLTIDCGFTAGSRFVMIKRTDSTGDWYVWDSARGIVAGNDPYLLLNSTAAEVTNTDYVDTANSGFEISSTAPAGINANGGTYIFLAIA